MHLCALYWLLDFSNLRHNKTFLMLRLLSCFKCFSFQGVESTTSALPPSHPQPLLPRFI